MRIVRLSFALLLAGLVSVVPLQATNGPVERGQAVVSVDCQRGSGLINVSILNHRKIGKVHLEVRDAKGRIVYVEDGKAMTGELVRRFDKGMFPKGEATLMVQARDFTITQSFVVQ